MLPKLITAEWLREKGAGCDQLPRFAASFPHGARVTRAAIRKARQAGLRVEWLLRFIPAAARATFAAATEVPRATCAAATEEAWANYAAVRAAAWATCAAATDAARATFEAATEAALLAALRESAQPRKEATPC